MATHLGVAAVCPHLLSQGLASHHIQIDSVSCLSQLNVHYMIRQLCGYVYVSSS